MANDWTNYFENTQGNPPSPILQRAIRIQSHPGTALDLGCGAGRDTKYLLEQGYKVTAVDSSPDAEKYLQKLPQGNLRFVCSTFEDLKFDSYDLVSSLFALSFMSPQNFPAVIAKISESVKLGGLFVGNIFGVKDYWNKPGSDMTFCTSEEARNLLSRFNLIFFEENQRDGKLADGSPKHWDVITFIGQKKG